MEENLWYNEHHIIIDGLISINVNEDKRGIFYENDT